MGEQKRRCFVIGPIGEVGSPIRKHADMLLNAVIKDVLEKEEFGYHVFRADEVADPGMINDRVIHDIINSELSVADLTFLNANVFYELGIRHSREKPVIHFAQHGTILPFDNVGHRVIIEDITSWQGIVSARNQLAAAAIAIQEPNYKVSNPITQANASFKMRESADPKDRVIAEMQDKIVRLEKAVLSSGERDTDTRDGTEWQRMVRDELERVNNELVALSPRETKKVKDLEKLQISLKEELAEIDRRIKRSVSKI